MKASLLLDDKISSYNASDTIEMYEDSGDFPMPLAETNISMNFGRLLLLTYVILSLVIIVGYIIVIFVEIQTIIMIITLSCIIIASICSYCGLYKFGIIQDQVQILKENNSIYEQQQIELHNTTQTLKKETNKLDLEINALNKHNSELEQQQKQFVELKAKLQQIANSGEDIYELIDDMNGSLERMNDLIYQNNKTYLLDCYYNAALRDGDITMNSEEYTKFLWRISPKWRKKFESRGNWKNIFGNKQSINVQEFLYLVAEILDTNRDLQENEFEKQYSSQISASFDLKKKLEEQKELEEQKDIVLIKERVMFEDEKLDIDAFRKERELSSKYFVDLIDDQHEQEILKFKTNFSSERISLKIVESGCSSKDDMDMDELRKQLGVKQGSYATFMTNYSKRGD
eukprot:371248_1